MNSSSLSLNGSKQAERHPALAIAAIFGVLLFSSLSRAQQKPAASSVSPETALTDALSAACRQDADTFAASLTVDNAAAFRKLPGPQRTAFLKRIVLLDDPGRPLLSTGALGRPVVRCDSAGAVTELRLGETRVRENLAFIELEIPVTGEEPRAITLGMVREAGTWKLLSVGLILLDIPKMARQWEEADLDAREDNAIASLRALANALDTYRRAYGDWPESLERLGPPPSAPSVGVSPQYAGLVDADLAAGTKDGYTFRYSILASGKSGSNDYSQADSYSLAALPMSYGTSGRRSFYLDSTGTLRGADKKGSVATVLDPKLGAS